MYINACVCVCAYIHTHSLSLTHTHTQVAGGQTKLEQLARLSINALADKGVDGHVHGQDTRRVRASHPVDPLEHQHLWMHSYYYSMTCIGRI